MLLAPLLLTSLRMLHIDAVPEYDHDDEHRAKILYMDEYSRNTSILLDSLLNGYDKKFRPNFGESETYVWLDLNIRSMGPISETDMTFMMDLYFRQIWKDKRLAYTGPLTELTLNSMMLKKIWRPDTYIFNGQASYLHTITTPNRMFRISQDGTVLYSQRLTIKARCPMKLRNYPMDTQNCPLVLGSYGYSSKDVIYQWYKVPDLSPDLTLSQFELQDHPISNLTEHIRKDASLAGEFHASKNTSHDDEYSMVMITFRLQRRMGYFLIQVYLPCSLLVILSWVGFWINREATADRIALGVTTVLTMTFLGIDTRADLPRVSYSTALDEFVALCFCFVLASILEFASVHYFTKTFSGEHQDGDIDDELAEEYIEKEKQKMKKVKNTRHLFVDSAKMMTMFGESVGATRHNGAATSDAADEPMLRETRRGGIYDTFYLPVLEDDSLCTRFRKCLSGSSKYRYIKKKTARGGLNSVSVLDRCCRVLFPALFGAINAVYWLVYVNAAVDDVDFK